MDNKKAVQREKFWKIGCGFLTGCFVLIIIAIIAAVIYFTRFSPDWRVMRITGGKVGDFEKGDVLIVSSDFTHPIYPGKAIVFEEERGGRLVNVVGVIKGVPGRGDVGKGHYLVETAHGDKEIKFEQVKWKKFAQ